MSMSLRLSRARSYSSKRFSLCSSSKAQTTAQELACPGVCVCLCVWLPVAAGQNSDYVVVVEQEGEEEEIKVHRMLLEARSPFFRGMLDSNMAEAQQGRYVVRDMLAPVVKAVLYFIYTGGRAAAGAAG